MTTGTFGWPSYLITSMAAKYCGCSKSTLMRAVAAGDISPCGKRGRSLVFDRAELDAWAKGEPVGGVAIVKTTARKLAKRSPSNHDEIRARLARIVRGS